MARNIYVGTTTAGAADGSSWNDRYGTLNAAEDKPVQAGDYIYVGPGVYRETLTCDVSGANVYTAGTVALTLNSPIVTGNGTLFPANTSAGYMFHCLLLTTGTDGQTYNSSSFTSALGNFQAGMVGRPIQINAKGAYTIASVSAVTTCTLADPNGLGWPATTTAATLAYSVMSGEGSYEIASVDSNTQLTLAEPWQGATASGLAYRTFNPIRYIADVTGEHTDGVGGPVRITGSNDDIAITRSVAVDVNGKNYRKFTGFTCDLVSDSTFYFNNNEAYCTVEDCELFDGRITFVGNPPLGNTIQRCLITRHMNGQALFFWWDPAVNNSGIVIKDCIIRNSDTGLNIQRIGGITITGCTFDTFASNMIAVSAALTVGQCVAIHDCILNNTGTALAASALGEIIEDYNAFSRCNTARNNVGIGGNSNTYPPLFTAPLLKSGFRFPWQAYELSKWSLLKRIAGVQETYRDYFGMARPVTSAKKSWGAIQYTGAIRDATTADSGTSIKLSDAGQQFVMRVPTTNATATISLKVYREADYTSTYPQMMVCQPGQTIQLTTDSGTSNTWNTLTITLPPAANPHFADVFAVSNNTTGAGSYSTFWDSLTVS